MTKFNPDFWELTISDRGWHMFSNEDSIYYKDPDEAKAREKRLKYAEKLWPEVREIMNTVLTERQSEILDMYFFKGYNQQEISEILNISQQSVSEHMYGKTRNGRNVGGAIRKLRKECMKRNIEWKL